MRYKTIRALVVASACAALAVVYARAANQTPPEHWYVDSLVKVFPEDTSAQNHLAVASFVGARNGHLSIQLALRAHRRMEKVTASVEGLEKTADRGIAWQIREVGYVVVVFNTKETPPSELIHRAPALFPDVLLENFPITLEPNKTQSLWVTLSIPADAMPGEYRAQLVVQEAGTEVVRAPFTLRIVKATVPPKQTLKVTNWFYLSDRQLRGLYGVKQLSEDWWTLLANIGRVLADHHQNMIVTPLTGFYFSKIALIDARPGQSGLEYDFSNFDRWVETFQKAGVIGYIEGSHVLRREEDPDDPEPLKVDVYVLENGKSVLKGLAPDDPRAEEGLRSMLASLHQHLKEKGWLDIYYQHVLDEVDDREMATYQKYASLVQTAMPGVRTMDAVHARRNLDLFEKSCDVWVPVLGSFDDLVPRLHRHVQDGGQAWFYTCLFPTGKYANRFIDFSLVKTRLLQWFNFCYDLPGFLHWGGNYWSPEPMNDTQPAIGSGWASSLLPSGDAFITYPDPQHKSICSSIRLEAMREGIEDYELLRELEKKHPGAGQAIAGKMIRSFTDYVRDPHEFRILQEQMLKELSQ